MTILSSTALACKDHSSNDRGLLGEEAALRFAISVVCFLLDLTVSLPSSNLGVRDNEDTLRFMVLSNGSPSYANFGSYSRFMIYANGNVQGTTANGAKFFLCDALRVYT